MLDSFKEKLKDKPKKDLPKHFKKNFSFGQASDGCSSVIKEEENSDEQQSQETDGDDHDITLLTS